MRFAHQANCVEHLDFQPSVRARGAPLRQIAPFSPLQQPSWEQLIDHIGSDDFLSYFLAALERLCRTDYTGMFQIDESSITTLAAISHDGSDFAAERISRYTSLGLWRYDPTVQHIHRGLPSKEKSLLKINLNALSNRFREKLYTGIVDKLVVTGVRNATSYSISVMRAASQSQFSSNDINNLLLASGQLISILAKHCETRERRPNQALTSLAEIETTVASAERLTPREMEVCARVLYGMCPAGIALDLNIGVETIKTYRNRAYQKIGINTQRELLMWYLSIWNPFNQHGHKNQPF